MANILLAQHDRTLRRYLSEQLTRNGHRVTITDDHDSMMLTVQHSNTDYDVLISDLGLDDRNSTELMQEVGMSVPNMRLIFISGFSGIGIVCTQHGLLSQRMVTRPFHLRELPEQINHLLASGIAA